MTKNNNEKPIKKPSKSPMSTESSLVSKTSKTKQIKSENKAKKLTLTSLSQESKKASETKKVPLLNGKYELNIQKTLLPTQIQQFLSDIQDALITLKSENASMQDANHYFIIYNICLIKNFTDLGIKHLQTSNKKDFSKLLDIAKELLDVGIMGEILNSFDPNEMKKIDDAVEKMKEFNELVGDLLITAALNEEKAKNKLGEIDATETIQ